MKLNVFRKLWFYSELVHRFREYDTILVDYIKFKTKHDGETFLEHLAILDKYFELESRFNKLLEKARNIMKKQKKDFPLVAANNYNLAKKGQFNIMIQEIILKEYEQAKIHS